MIIMVINRFINKVYSIILSQMLIIKDNNNIHYSKSFSFLIIMNYLGISLPDNVEIFAQYVFGVITLSLIALISFINIIMYFFIIYIFNKYKIEEKYPILKNNLILKWIIKKYKQTTIFFIVIETIIGISSLSLLFVLSVLGFKNMIM